MARSIASDQVARNRLLALAGAIVTAPQLVIDAAPYMYWALCEIRLIAEQHVEDLAEFPNDPVCKMERARWQAVLDALAKAEGNAP